MTRDAVERDIVEELRSLRRQPGRLDAAKMVSARIILRGFGGDDPHIALTRLIDLATENRDDRDIAAAVASLGWGVDSEGSLDRLAEYSERHYVDPRTVRRWSDAGINKLALLIVGSEPWIQPRARLVMVAVDESLAIGLDLRIPANLRMERPRLLVGREPVEVRMPEITTKSDRQRLRSGLQPIAPLIGLPIRLRINWSGDKFPIYEAVTRGRPDIFFNSRIVFRSLMVTISRHDSK